MPTFALQGTAPAKTTISTLPVDSGHVAARLFEAALKDAKEQDVAFENLAPRTLQTPYYLTQVDGDAAGRTAPLIDGRWCVGRFAKVANEPAGWTVTGGEENGPAVTLAVLPTSGLAFWFAAAWRAGLVPPLSDKQMQAAIAGLAASEPPAAVAA